MMGEVRFPVAAKTGAFPPETRSLRTTAPAPNRCTKPEDRDRWQRNVWFRAKSRHTTNDEAHVADPKQPIGKWSMSL